MYIPQINRYSLEFPHPSTANEEGIVAWGGDLNPSRIIRAYQEGIFPWNSPQDPILWWSPNPRFIMELDDFKLRKSLKKSMKKFTYKFDTNFLQVIKNCASTPRKEQTGSWIQDEVIDSFEVLHGMGKVHSVETYFEGELVGGLYGIVVGRLFCGESMFAHKSDASKAAYAVLVAHLKKWDFDFIDCQVPTEHLRSLGAKEVSRDYFLERLERVAFEESNSLWEFDSSLLDGGEAFLFS